MELPYTKRWFSVILLVLFSYNVLLCHASLWLWKIYMNEQIEEMANTLSDESLYSITQPYTGSIESEIELNGAMYDVVRYVQTGNTITYLCVKDFMDSLLSSADSKLSKVSLGAKNQMTNYAHLLNKKVTEKFVPQSIVNYCYHLLIPLIRVPLCILPPSIPNEVEIIPPRFLN